MNSKKLYIILGIIFILIFSCKPKGQKSEEIEKSAFLSDKNAVEIIVLNKSNFKKQLVSNGKLYALLKSDLQFSQNGKIDKIAVENGRRVKEGALIATLESFDFKQLVKQAEDDLKKSKLELQDALIGMGYNFEDSINIPDEKMELAQIRSGYAQSKTSLLSAQEKLNNCMLRAPFDGIIANLNNKPFEAPSGNTFCTLIDDRIFEVSFQIMETEMNEIALNDAVKVVPYAFDKVYKGKITAINPVVDRNGLIEVKALVANPGKLMEGMNVKVIIGKEVPNQFVVPKSAVVLRDNWEVLFKVVNGKAYWTYVRTQMENSDSYSVIPHPEKSSASLNVGDTIIVSGNLNLAHESEITFE